MGFAAPCAPGGFSCRFPLLQLGATLEDGVSQGEGVQSVWGPRSPGAPTAHPRAGLCTLTPSMAPSGDAGLAVPDLKHGRA